MKEHIFIQMLLVGRKGTSIALLKLSQGLWKGPLSLAEWVGEAEAVPDLGPVGGSRDETVRRAGQTSGPQIYCAHNSPSKLFQTQALIQEI